MRASTNYDPKALMEFAQFIKGLRKENKNSYIPKCKVNEERIPDALEVLPKKDRENLEKFFGLRGGINHSKKANYVFAQDRALNDLRIRGLNSLRKMTSRLEIVRIYDSSVDELVEQLVKKVDKQGLEYLTNLYCAKYVMAYAMIFENGPKFLFENDPMQIEEDENGGLSYLDEYELLREICTEIYIEKDGFLNLKLIIEMVEMASLNDTVAIKANFGIQDKEIFDNDEIAILRTLGTSISTKELWKREDFVTYNFLRRIKENIFQKGAWEIAQKIVWGYPLEKLDEFLQTIAEIYKHGNWVLEIEQYLTEKETSILTSKGVQTFRIYNIGGVEFTDPEEIDFLYLNAAC